MGVSVNAGEKSQEIGAASFFNAFFSSITVLLENKHRGSQFPLIAKFYHEGRLSQSDIKQVIRELQDVRLRLMAFSPNAVIWNMDDTSKKPPWGDNNAPNITSMSNYFTTSDGKDLFDALLELLDYAEKNALPVFIE